MTDLSTRAEARIHYGWRKRVQAWDAGERGPGSIDLPMIAVVEAINLIPGVSTLQSCCGHPFNNKCGKEPGCGHLWLRLSPALLDRVDFPILASLPGVLGVSAHCRAELEIEITFEGLETSAMAFAESCRNILVYLTGVVEEETAP